MIVVPAPLEQERDVLIRNVNRLSGYYARFQIDIGDGCFVENTTVQTKDVVDGFSFVQANNVVFDFHLMVDNPESHIKEIERLSQKNVGIVFIHKTVFTNHQLLTAHHQSCRFGLVLSPEDEVADLADELICTLPAIQIMTVHPGFQGKPFMKEVLIKVEQLRKRGFGGEILLDGGINEETLPYIMQQKYIPDVLCVGSFLTKSPPEELQKRVAQLKTIIDTRE